MAVVGFAFNAIQIVFSSEWSQTIVDRRRGLPEPSREMNRSIDRRRRRRVLYEYDTDIGVPPTRGDYVRSTTFTRHGFSFTFSPPVFLSFPGKTVRRVFIWFHSSYTSFTRFRFPRRKCITLHDDFVNFPVFTFENPIESETVLYVYVILPISRKIPKTNSHDFVLNVYLKLQFCVKRHYNCYTFRRIRNYIKCNKFSNKALVC